MGVLTEILLTEWQKVNLPPAGFGLTLIVLLKYVYSTLSVSLRACPHIERNQTIVHKKKLKHSLLIFSSAALKLPEQTSLLYKCTCYLYITCQTMAQLTIKFEKNMHKHNILYNMKCSITNMCRICKT